MKLSVLAIAATSALGCMSASVSGQSCRADSECPGGQVCFFDGCGDPGEGLVAEVTGDARAGQFAQDFAIDGGITQRLDFDLRGPLSFSGEFQRERTPQVNPLDRTVYAEGVMVRAVGTSATIPGISRSFQARFDRPERGVYSMNVGGGVYELTALPYDTSVPPDVHPGLSIPVGSRLSQVVTFAFPSIEGTITISGRLLKQRLGGTPPIEIPPTDTAMDLQAFDPLTHMPLSQRTPVASGTAGSRGDFTLALNPVARQAATIVLVASPREASPSVLAPTKSFTVSQPLPPTLTLEMGNYGEPLPQVGGRIVARDGSGVAGAAVVLTGVVGGGGRIRSRVVTTDAAGNFAVDVLPSAPDYLMTIVPPAESASASRELLVTAATGSRAFNPREVILENRILVSGSTVSPIGVLESSVTVRAVEMPAAERVLKLGEVKSTTSSGQFQLFLEPGTWTLEFSGGDLPRTSRILRVTPEIDPQTQLPKPTLHLGSFELSRGRRLTGTVTASSPDRNTSIVPFATVRFFHLGTANGKPSALLIGTATTDERGTYSVNLPAR